MMAGRTGHAPADPAAALRDLLAAMNRLDAEVVLATGGLPLDDAVRAELRRAQRAMLALPPIDGGWLDHPLPAA